MTRTIANVLSTAIDRTYQLPSFSPSRRDVRNLFDALEDLVLPMGSFPSEDLHPWAPTDLNPDSNPSASPLSMMPSPGSTGSEHDGESLPPKPALSDGGVKHLSIAPPTKSTLRNVGPKSTVMRSLTLPKHNDSRSAPSTKSASTGRKSMGDQSKSAVVSALVTSTHGNHAEVPLPEQTVVETNTLGSVSIAVGEEYQEEQQDGVGTAAVKEVSTGTMASFENAVRDLHNLVQLVADMMKQRTEAEENTRSETLRSKRAEEDLRHWWEDMRGVFERIISGQNIALQLSRDENHELVEENRKLKLEHSVDEDKRKDILEEYNAQLRTLKAEKEFAEETAKTAETAKAEAVDRINTLREDYENAKVAAEGNHEKERNSLISSKIYARSERNEARSQIKDKERTIEELEATISQMRSTVTTSEELAASDKRHLEKQLEDRCKEKDSEISTLTDQLRESKAEVKSMSGWKDAAEAEKRNRKGLSKQLEEERTRLREDKKRAIDKKNLDIRDLETTVKTKKADISRLEGTIASLEAGEEVRGLKSQLEESEKQRRVSAKKVQDMEQQLQNCRRELKSTIKARDKNISEAAEKASKEKEDLKQELEQTTRVSQEGLQEKLRELGEQKDDLVRKLAMAQNAQRLHNQTAAEHERMIVELNEEIHRLQLNEQYYENHNKTAVENANTLGNIVEEAKGRIGELERDKGELERDKVAIGKAANEAAESVRQMLQKQLENETQSFRKAKEKATKTENELRNEMGVLRSQVNNVEKSHSIDPAGPEAGKEAQMVEELFKQANDANNLLLEIGANGMAKKSVEQTVLCQLNDAKIALHRVKGVLFEPPARYHRGRLVKILDGVNVNEERIAELPIDSALVSQAKMANARLLRLEKILDANADVQRDAMLEALRTPTPFEREIRKPRALRRPAKPSPPLNPSTGGQTEVSMGQSQQTNGAPEQQYNPPIFNLQQSAQPQIQSAASQIQIQDFGHPQSGGPTNGPVVQPDAKVALDFTSVRGAPAASDNPLFQSFTMVDTETGGPSMPKNNNQNGASADKPTVVKRDHRQPFMDLLASLKPAADYKASGAMPVANAPSPVPSLQGDRQASMPEGWTDEMTGTVRAMHGEDNLFIGEMVKELHGLQVKDPEGFEKWLNKLRADHEAEMNPNLDPALSQFPPNA